MDSADFVFPIRLRLDPRSCGAENKNGQRGSARLGKMFSLLCPSRSGLQTGRVCRICLPPPARPLSHKTDFIRHESKRWPLMIYSARFITAAPWPSKLGRTRLHSAKNESYSRWVFCLVFVVCLVWFGLVWFFFHFSRRVSPTGCRRPSITLVAGIYWAPTS